MNGLHAHAIDVDLGGRRTLEGTSLALEKGRLVGLIGPNGAGKTTLLRALARLLPLAGGELTLEGRPAATWSNAAYGRAVAYLAQGAVAHWPLTVERLVALGRLPHLAPWTRPRDSDRAAIDRALAACDVTHLAARPVTALSGGERARVLMARALAVGACFLLADEPVAGLDPSHQLQVMEGLKSEATGGAGVVVVLHDLTLAARFCDRLVLLDQGRAVAEGTPREVLTPERLAKVYGIRVRKEAGGGGDGGKNRADLPLNPWERLESGS